MEPTYTRKLRLLVTVIVTLVTGGITGCSNECSNKVTGINLSSPGNNPIRVRAEVNTISPVEIAVEYWPSGAPDSIYITSFDSSGTLHYPVLTNLQPQRTYKYQVISRNNGCTSRTKEYDFTTSAMPLWLEDLSRVICPDTSVLPTEFSKGYVMVYRRETPGLISILDAEGKTRWYHQVNGTGFKVAHFTQAGNILAILGTEDYQTSYGNEILELSLTGDTLLHLKKGESDFLQTIHHEIFSDHKDHIVVISSEEKIMNLSSKGGGKADTVKSDGIRVFDRKGRLVWNWSVFDVLDPLTDKNIAKDKSDWMHANSLCQDKDGNYLLSFYNNGQIWKIDASTGKLLWKFGKGGDFELPANAAFDNSHAIHITSNGNLMLFDNGTTKKLSRTLEFSLDEKLYKAKLVNEILLPVDVYSERMGSAYYVNDTSVLHTASKRNTVVLTNMKGRFLWALRTGTTPYRAEFLTASQLSPYIKD